MSESVQQLLLQGIAAVKSTATKDPAEPRLCFKQVLASPEATTNQKVLAWLWLSQLENNAVDKQFCLEQALLIDPNNSLAQRGLIILKKRCTTTNDEQAHTANRIWRSVCPQCGGSMEFDVAHNQVTCQFCGHHRDPRSTLHHMAGEQDFLAALPTQRAQNWHLAVMQTFKCAGCGATFTLPQLETSGECPFCGSLHVMEITAEDELIEPDGILIFQIDELKARHAIEDWLGHLRQQLRLTTPAIRTSRLRAVYLPYWTFDLSGQITFDTHYQPIYDLQNRIIDGEWVRTTRAVFHDDLLVPATRTISQDLLEQVSLFNTRALQPYSSEILAAWSAEVYQVSLADASLIARQHAVKNAQQGTDLEIPLNLDIPHTARVDSSLLRVQSYKLVLLPMWLGRYRLQDQIYRLVINGQTGKTAGEKPPASNGWRHQLGRLLGIE